MESSPRRLRAHAFRRDAHIRSELINTDTAAPGSFCAYAIARAASAAQS